MNSNPNHRLNISPLDSWQLVWSMSILSQSKHGLELLQIRHHSLWRPPQRMQATSICKVTHQVRGNQLWMHQAQIEATNTRVHNKIINRWPRKELKAIMQWLQLLFLSENHLPISKLLTQAEVLWVSSPVMKTLIIATEESRSWYLQIMDIRESAKLLSLHLIMVHKEFLL